MKTILRIFYLIALFASPVQGLENKAHKIISSKSIKNLDECLQKAEKALGFPVLFPTFISDPRARYAYTEVLEAGPVILSLSLDETCHGAKFCTVGSLSIKKGDSPEMRKDMGGKSITEVVKLRDNINGYYTPGHPMGDYWPPSLQWVYKDTLYDLWWQESDRQALIDMANSAISSSSKKRIIP